MPSGELSKRQEKPGAGTQGRLDNSQTPLDGGKRILLLSETPSGGSPQNALDGLELVYQRSGKSDWVVGGGPVRLRQGELLMMGPEVARRVQKTGPGNAAAHFWIPMEFVSGLIRSASPPIPQTQFMLDCLFARSGGQGCLHFQVAEDTSIQNLVDNLLAALVEEPHQESVNRMTAALLLAKLFGRSDTIPWRRQDRLVWRMLEYIQQNYVHGSLTKLSELLGRDVSFLSRELHRRTGRTYTELVQEQRMAHAAKLLRETDMRVNDIARQVGYENISYFHRLFYAAYAMTPGQYRSRK